MAITITKDLADRLISEITDFEKATFGIRCGFDFAEFVSILSTSESFRSLCKGATMIGMLTVCQLSETPDEKVLEDIIKSSPMNRMTMDVLYIGYRLGLAEVECRDLTRLRDIPSVGEPIQGEK